MNLHVCETIKAERPNVRCMSRGAEYHHRRQGQTGVPRSTGVSVDQGCVSDPCQLHVVCLTGDSTMGQSATTIGCSALSTLSPTAGAHRCAWLDWCQCRSGCVSGPCQLHVVSKLRTFLAVPGNCTSVGTGTMPSGSILTGRLHSSNLTAAFRRCSYSDGSTDSGITSMRRLPSQGTMLCILR